MKTARAYALRVVLVILAAYIGAMAGAVIYGHNLALDWHEVNPYGLVATIRMATGTPVANLLLVLAAIYSVMSVARRWPLWSYSFVAVLFAVIAYALRAAWQT